MILGENIDSVYSGGKEIQRVYSKGMLVWEKEPIDYTIIPFTVRAIDAGARVWMGKRDPNTGKTIKVDIKYSINNGKWIEGNGVTIELKKNDKVSIITNDIDYLTVSGDRYWNGEGYSYAASDIYGNIMSLIYGDDFIGQTVWTERTTYYANSGFFYGDIRNAKNLILPATTLSKNAYSRMFYGMTSLITAPALPATILSEGCYTSMFYGCINLVKAPVLPANILVKGCYGGMFAYCTSLNYVKCYATEFATDSIDEVIRYYDDENKVWVESNKWLAGIKTSGEILCHNSFADSLKPYIPSTWTVEYLN